jgi:uncharacterized protein YqjF (DUF2071 family)
MAFGKKWPFLTAEWRNLILAQYAVPDSVAQPYLPPGVELDRWQGSAVVSLVGFQFLRTRVLGIPWPGFRHFPEWNLRIYVRYQGQRGVCFVREFVPQRLVAWMARTIYNEPYRATKMTMAIEPSAESIPARYTLDWEGRTHTMTATGSFPAERPAAEGLETFFKEHSWGFGQSKGGRLIRYEVEHPEWEIYPVKQFQCDLDWGLLYGPEWSHLQGRPADSVVLAVGSKIAVYPKGKV